jgi:hypothetical protein
MIKPKSHKRCKSDWDLRFSAADSRSYQRPAVLFAPFWTSLLKVVQVSFVSCTFSCCYKGAFVVAKKARLVLPWSHTRLLQSRYGMHTHSGLAYENAVMKETNLYKILVEEGHQIAESWKWECVTYDEWLLTHIWLERLLPQGSKVVVLEQNLASFWCMSTGNFLLTMWKWTYKGHQTVVSRGGSGTMPQTASSA